MADYSSTTTVISTTTVTSTRTLTWTVYSTASLTPASTNSLPLKPTHITNVNHQHTYQSLYPYSPSLPLAIIFTFLYFITTIHQGYLSIYLPTRPETVNKHRYTIPLFVGGLLSTAGYLIRCVSIQQSHASELSLYAASTALIIISPIFLCATLYILLARLIKRCLTSPTVQTPTTVQTRQSNPQNFLPLSPRFLSMTFLASDVVSFLVQLLGVAIAASNNYTDPSLSRGTHVVLTGLALQLVTFLLFLLVLHLFCRRVHNSSSHGFNPLIMKVIVGTWVASGFILLRTVFRLGEFAAGPRGYAFIHEWCLYVFEALPVWCALVVLGWWHPVKWIQERVLAQTGRVITVGMDKLDGVVLSEPVADNSGSRGSGKSARNGHVRKRSHLGFSK